MGRVEASWTTDDRSHTERPGSPVFGDGGTCTCFYSCLCRCSCTATSTLGKE
ncbi:hypothetical protein B0O80DRAFT_475275 [Mortierella sp. GBAus27b]|nr:hypothetical protein B0O80DRAFT_475275 [Mortierella sp. GBAus27b]